MRLQRRIKAAAMSRPHRHPHFPEYTPEAMATLDRIKASRPWPEGPVAMLPVAQLYVRDIEARRTDTSGDHFGASLEKILVVAVDRTAVCEDESRLSLSSSATQPQVQSL